MESMARVGGGVAHAEYDFLVVGGGFFGLRLALFAREELGFARVAVVEKEPELMNRASFVNQARVHNGYHYPRSILTAYRSRVNFPRFVDEFSGAVVGDSEHYYAISRRLSKVSARQFEIFCDRIGAGWSPAVPSVAGLFNQHLVEGVYRVDEPAFDARILRDLLVDRIVSVGGVDVVTSTEVIAVESGPEGVVLVRAATGQGPRVFTAGRVVSAVYSRINVLHRASDLPVVGLQHEIAEMPLVRLPSGMEDLAFTVMDGPFFSMMPFPSLGVHTLSHVRYTPRRRWHDLALGGEVRDPHRVLSDLGAETGFDHMFADVVRHMPVMSGMVQVGSLREVKTVLSRSEGDDSRPILFRPDHGLSGYTCVMGGKLDNVYDVMGELAEAYG